MRSTASRGIFFWVACSTSLATAYVMNNPLLFLNRRPAYHISRLSWEEDNDRSHNINDIEDDNDNSREDENVVPSKSTLFIDHQQWMTSVQTTIQQLEKKTKSLQSELEKAESLEATVARARLITNNLYLFSSPSIKQMSVQDWENDGKEVELTLDPSFDSAVAEADALFQQARKLKRGSAVVQTIMEETTRALEILLDAQIDLQAARLDNEQVNENMFLLVQDRLLRSAKTTKFSPPQKDLNAQQPTPRAAGNKIRKPELGTPASNIRKIISPYSGCTILVGRNRRGNEYLSFKEARHNDVWLHARGTPGAHVLILQRSPQNVATDECWQLAANLAAFYSDGRADTRVDIMAAEPKHILKPAGSPLGTVKIRQELKVVTGFPDQVPVEFKEARDASGQATSYRRTDKAKLKKRNKESILKEKQRQKEKRKKKKEEHVI